MCFKHVYKLCLTCFSIKHNFCVFVVVHVFSQPYGCANALPPTLYNINWLTAKHEYEKYVGHLVYTNHLHHNL